MYNVINQAHRILKTTGVFQFTEFLCHLIDSNAVIANSYSWTNDTICNNLKWAKKEFL